MKTQKEIERLERGCHKRYVKDNLVFYCGDGIYGPDLCPKCQKKIEELENGN